MSFIDKLSTDTNNAFVQLLRQYQSEGRLDQEFARRQRVYADRSAGRATTDAIGAGTHGRGRPAITPDETRGLLQNIISGKVVPSPVQNYALALQLGLVGGEAHRFIDLGGQYIMDMAVKDKTSPEAESKEAPVVFPPGEMFGSAIVDLMRQRRFTNRHDAIVAPDDPYFAKLTRSSNKIFFIKHKDRSRQDPITKLICGGDEALSTKLGVFVKRLYHNALNPSEYFLTDQEIETVARNLKLNDRQRLRLQIAHENTRAYIAYMQDPAIQDALIIQIFKSLDNQEFHGKNVLGEDDGGAFAALQRIFHIRKIGVTDVAVTKDWSTLKNAHATASDREAAYDRIASHLHIVVLDGADKFKQQVLSEDISRASAARRGKRIGEIIDDSGVVDNGQLGR